MKIFENLSPKRFFGSRKSLSRSDPSSSSSSSSGAAARSGDSSTPTSVLRAASGDWSDLSAAEIKPEGGAGLVSIEELEELLGRLGAEPPSREEVAAAWSEVGCDGDGRVDVDALVSRVGSVCGPTGESELRETFDFFDADRDGRITEKELLGVFRAVGDEVCTLEDCRRMIAVVDENGDGFVCFADFSRMMELQS